MGGHDGLATMRVRGERDPSLTQAVCHEHVARIPHSHAASIRAWPRGRAGPSHE